MDFLGGKFFLPVKVLSVVFRGKFLDALERAFKNQAYSCRSTHSSSIPKQSSPLCYAPPPIASGFVYAKRPFAGPAQVLTYLSRYTHRIAIANSRLVAMADGRVTFQWRDYAHGHQTRTMTLEADEFLRRFLLHVLPTSFVRIATLAYSQIVTGPSCWLCVVLICKPFHPHRSQTALDISVNIAIVAPCG